MKLIGREILINFAEEHHDAKARIMYLINEFEEAKWNKPTEIKAVHPSASLLTNNYMIIDVGGNKYRLLLQVNYRAQIIYCKEIGKHSEYDNWKLK